MATYAIGDLQGCYAEFEALLERLDFSPSRDHLWLAGDLVNRGPDSLGCLRRSVALDGAASVVLGNHDLHLLAVARGHGKLKRNDTLTDILEAPDRSEMLEWLRVQPLLVADRERSPVKNGYVMTHAGLLPQWSLAEAAELAAEAELGQLLLRLLQRDSRPMIRRRALCGFAQPRDGALGSLKLGVERGALTGSITVHIGSPCLPRRCAGQERSVTKLEQAARGGEPRAHGRTAR